MTFLSGLLKRAFFKNKHKASKSFNPKIKIIIKFLVLNITRDTREDNKNSKNIYTLKLVTSVNCSDYLIAKINLISQRKHKIYRLTFVSVIFLDKIIALKTKPVKNQ